MIVDGRDQLEERGIVKIWQAADIDILHQLATDVADHLVQQRRVLDDALTLGIAHRCELCAQLRAQQAQRFGFHACRYLGAPGGVAVACGQTCVALDHVGQHAVDARLRDL